MSLLSCSLFKIVYSDVPKTSCWASGKCVDSDHIFTCILELIPPAPVRASPEAYVSEATFFVWVKIVRGTGTAKLIRFM